MRAVGRWRYGKKVAKRVAEDVVAVRWNNGICFPRNYIATGQEIATLSKVGGIGMANVGP